MEARRVGTRCAEPGTSHAGKSGVPRPYGAHLSFSLNRLTPPLPAYSLSPKHLSLEKRVIQLGNLRILVRHSLVMSSTKRHHRTHGRTEKKFGKKISRHHLTREINFPKLSLFRDRPTDGLITRLSSSVIFRTCVLFVCLCVHKYADRSKPSIHDDLFQAACLERAQQIKHLRLAGGTHDR